VYEEIRQTSLVAETEPVLSAIVILGIPAGGGKDWESFVIDDPCCQRRRRRNRRWVVLEQHPSATTETDIDSSVSIHLVTVDDDYVNIDRQGRKPQGIST